ncbi:phage portal protein, partial [Bacillus thuringiensis]|nr:phage portal protein [Bacillus thuringiensis]
IGYNLVRTAITSPDNVADMLGFPKQNTKESQSIYMSNDITEIGKKEAADGSVEGGD